MGSNFVDWSHILGPNRESARMERVAFAVAAGSALALLVARVRGFRGRGGPKGSAGSLLTEMRKKERAIMTAEDDLGIRLNPDEFIDFLGRLIGESERLQNFPPEFVPKEDLICTHIISILNDYSKENGGPLQIEKVSFTEGRSNLIIRYPGRSKSSPTIGLIGSHLDVVPAVKENWKRDPFHLTVEGDKLFGRGTTDCLGHIALLTLFFRELARKRPNLEANVIAVFICSEEATDVPGIGVDGLEKDGYLEPLKNGTCLWIDASDSEPCIGTAGALQWHLKVTGKRFHSGFPNYAINPIELGSESVQVLQDKFYKEFPPHEQEQLYHFLNPSTMKPTQVSAAKGGLNQIPPTATFSGDVRLTPFYSCRKVVEKMEEWVDEMNRSNFAELGRRGPVSDYKLPKENLEGRLKLEWAHEVDDFLMEGIACKLDSPGFLSICEAIKSVRGSVKPYSICGSLPLVRSMQKAGFDLQITGFGKSDAYHAENEYCLLSDMVNAGEILSVYVSKLQTHYLASANKPAN